MTFRQELAHLLNKHNKEVKSDTPDFVLAQYLSDSLAAFDLATAERTAWYDKND